MTDRAEKKTFVHKCLEYLSKNMDTHTGDNLTKNIINRLLKDIYPFLRFVVIVLVINALTSSLSLILVALSYFKST